MWFEFGLFLHSLGTPRRIPTASSLFRSNAYIPWMNSLSNPLQNVCSLLLALLFDDEIELNKRDISVFDNDESNIVSIIVEKSEMETDILSADIEWSQIIRRRSISSSAIDCDETDSLFWFIVQFC